MKGREKNMLHGNHSARVKNISYLLDKYPGAACAYSLMRLRKNYVGPLIRINVSGVTTDIYSKHDTITGLDYIDWLEIYNKYPGATIVSVDKWYDQSGNGYDLTGGAVLPVIKDNESVVSHGDNRHPFYNLNGFIGLANNVSNCRLINSSINISAPITFFTVQNIGGTRATGVVFDSYNSSQCVLYNTGTLESPNYRYSIANGANVRNASEIVGTQMNLTSGVLGGSNGNFGVNRGFGNNVNQSTNALNGLSVFNLRGNPNPLLTGYFWSGLIYQVIIYQGDLRDKINIIREDLIKTYKLNSVLNSRS